jgi:hypothetical protein
LNEAQKLTSLVGNALAHEKATALYKYTKTAKNPFIIFKPLVYPGKSS